MDFILWDNKFSKDEASNDHVTTVLNIATAIAKSDTHILKLFGYMQFLMFQYLYDINR